MEDYNENFKKIINIYYDYSYDNGSTSRNF